VDVVGVVVGTGGDGVEDSRGPSTMSIAAAWERSGRRRSWGRRRRWRIAAALRTISRTRQKMAKAAIVIANVEEQIPELAAVRVLWFGCGCVM
jgi:hypothetical protein